ncbi:MAG: hypothetical protein KDA42_07360 [Planctomycetales bacterium]|nr:hypothetical protein [Planctomycetales bacterium]
MAKCDLTIEFERPNRTYHTGEEVRGQIVVRANQDVRCDELAVEHFWQTHGRGNRDTGDRARTVLFTGEWRVGEVASYPFRFLAPPGPATYRGNYINVDHYVAARVSVPWAFDPKCQEEFLLAPTPPEYFAGIEMADDAVQKLGGFSNAVSVPLAVILLVVGALCFFPFGIILIPVGLVMLYFAIRKQMAEKRIGDVELCLDSINVVPGGHVPLALSVRPRKSTPHNGITARLVGQEKAVSGSGTNKSTHTHTFFDETTTLVAAGTLDPAAPLALQTQVPIPADAAYSFFAPENKVLWHLTVRIDVPRWPDWVHTHVLLVRPFLRNGASRDPAKDEPRLAHARPMADNTSVLDAAIVADEPAPIDHEAMATDDEQWEDPYAEAPEPPAPHAPPESDSAAAAERVSPLLATLADLAATDRFGGRRETAVKALAGQVFDCAIVVEDVSHTFGYVDDRTFREGRTIKGTLAGSEQKVSMLFRQDRNAEFDDLRHGDHLAARCTIVGWDDLYSRAELQEA